MKNPRCFDNVRLRILLIQNRIVYREIDVVYRVSAKGRSVQTDGRLPAYGGKTKSETNFRNRYLTETKTDERQTE